MADLDQGGVARQFVNVKMGPSIGWVPTQLAGFPTATTITSGGGHAIVAGTSVVEVNFNGSVTIQLPSSLTTVPNTPAITIPPLANPPNMTITDTGGFAAVHPITIQPFGAETVLGQSSIQIASNFGAITLAPIPTGGWAQA